MPLFRRPIASRLWRFSLITSLVLVLLLVGVGLAKHLAERLREPLAAALTTRLGLEVRLGHLSLGLAGLVPRVTLEEVDLMSPGDPSPQLHLRRLHLDLDPLASLGSWSPQVRDITLVGPRLRLVRRGDGQLAIAGLGEGGGDGERGDPRALALFMARGRLRLTEGEIEWLDQGTQAPPMLLSEVRLDLDNHDLGHHLELEARLASDAKTQLRVSADLQGDAATPDDWSGMLDFTLQAGDPGSPMAALLPYGLRFAEDRLTLEGHYRLEGSRLAAGHARLRLEGLSIQGQIPGQGPLRFAAGRLDLDLMTDQRVGGRLQIKGEGLQLNLPGVFGDRPPIRLDHLVGPLTWVSDPEGGLQLASEGLDALNPDLGLKLRFSLRHLGAAMPIDPTMELQADIRNAKAGAIRHYLPDAKLKPQARAWLERAFPSGRIPMGQVLVQGRLADFPFREDQGYFHVLLWVEGMSLDFHPDWPPLEGLEGVVHFHNQAMHIATTGGDILDFPLVEAQAEILDLADAQVVRVRGSARGDFDQALGFPGATPLRASLGGFPDLFKATGLVQVDLDMDIPLGHDHPKDRVRLAGTLSWPGPASLTLTGADLGFEDIRGVLDFNQDGVMASRIEAQSLGAPLSLALDRIRSDKGPRLTELKLAGATSVQALARRHPHPLWRQLEGEIPWDVTVRIPDPRAPRGISALQADCTLTSDLQGLAIKLPQPLGKKRGEVRHLGLNWQSQAGKETQVRGRYDDLGLNLLFAGDGKGRLGLRRGTIALGGEPEDLPGADGLWLTGHLPELDLNAWRDWMAGLMGGGPSGGPRWTVADLGIDRLQVGPAQLQGVRLDLEQKAQAWEVQIQAEELAGRLSIPIKPRSQPLRAEFERLDLKPLLGQGRPESGAGPTAPREMPTREDPRQVQTLELAVEQLRWSDRELGRLTLNATATEQGLAIENLRLAGPPRVKLAGTGAWAQENAEPRTRLDLEGSTADLGELLRHLDYASYLEQAPATVLARLSWPGGPTDLNLATLGGEVEVKIGKGSLLQVDPGVGRVLGVLNLGALGRRLSLDFTDLFDRGFVFEGITGKLGIHAGWVELRDPLVIEGSSAEIKIAGRANLKDETLDQVATVTPRLGGGVALASAIVAGPLVGAAVLLADKATGGAFDVIGRHSYDIRGPWANPDIVPRARLTPPSNGEAPAASVGPEVSGQERAKDGAAPRSTRPDSEANAFLDQP